MPSLVSLISEEQSNSVSNLTSDNSNDSDSPNDDLPCNFTDHFQKWLHKNNYETYNFTREDIICGTFGGKTDKQDAITKVPIIFVHGTCDIGYGRGPTDGYVSWQTGFRSMINWFAQEKGYKSSEMYVTTWGPGNAAVLETIYHSKAYVLYMRAFVEAVLAYTGASQVNIISHSLGVAISRKIVKGGSATDHSVGTYFVGDSLQSKVKNFIGIAGVNYGLMQCIPAAALSYCNRVDGLFPGATSISSPSTFLNTLNSQSGTEGGRVFTVWSKSDELILNSCVVWGKVTSRIPGQMDEIIKDGMNWGHFDLRDRIGP